MINLVEISKALSELADNISIAKSQEGITLEDIQNEMPIIMAELLEPFDIIEQVLNDKLPDGVDEIQAYAIKKEIEKALLEFDIEDYKNNMHDIDHMITLTDNKIGLPFSRTIMLSVLDKMYNIFVGNYPTHAAFINDIRVKFQ